MISDLQPEHQSRDSSIWKSYFWTLNSSSHAFAELWLRTISNFHLSFAPSVGASLSQIKLAASQTQHPKVIQVLLRKLSLRMCARGFHPRNFFARRPRFTSLSHKNTRVPWLKFFCTSGARIYAIGARFLQSAPDNNLQLAIWDSSPL